MHPSTDKYQNNKIKKTYKQTQTHKAKADTHIIETQTSKYIHIYTHKQICKNNNKNI